MPKICKNRSFYSIVLFLSHLLLIFSCTPKKDNTLDNLPANSQIQASSTNQEQITLVAQAIAKNQIIYYFDGSQLKLDGGLSFEALSTNLRNLFTSLRVKTDFPPASIKSTSTFLIPDGPTQGDGAGLHTIGVVVPLAQARRESETIVEEGRSFLVTSVGKVGGHQLLGVTEVTPIMSEEGATAAYKKCFEGGQTFYPTGNDLRLGNDEATTLLDEVALSGNFFDFKKFYITHTNGKKTQLSWKDFITNDGDEGSILEVNSKKILVIKGPLLGQGSYGTVRKITIQNVSSGKRFDFAIKSGTLDAENQTKMTAREFYFSDAMSRLPDGLGFYGGKFIKRPGVASSGFYVSLMEVADGAWSAEKTLKVPIPQLRTQIAHAALSLAAIHRAGFLHNDIKTLNTLYRRDDTAMMSDLATLSPISQNKLTTIYGIGPPEWSSGSLKTPSKPYDPRQGEVYSFAVSALELFIPYPDMSFLALSDVRLKKISDPFGLCCIKAQLGQVRFLENAANLAAHQDLVTLLRKNRETNPNKIFRDDLSDADFEFLLMCLNFDPSKRPTLEEVASHFSNRAGPL